MRNITQRWPKSGHLFPKLGHSFPIFKKGRGDLPPPLPSSYTPAEYASGISKVKCNVKVKFTFYANVQRKVNTHAKMEKSKYCRKCPVSCKSVSKNVWLNSWNNCSQMLREISVLKFLGKHACCRPLLPRCAAWGLERY